MKKIIIIPLLILAISLKAATYYVAPSTASPAGNDAAAGTIGAPWLTWQKAFTTAIAGDTVYFRGGIYYATAQVYKASGSGTRAEPICFFNYPNEVPILDGINKVSESHGIYISGVDNIHFKGLTVRNNLQIAGDQVQGFLVANCTNITFTQCVSHHNGYRGFNLFQTDTAYFYNCDAYSNSDTLSAGPGNGGDGFNFWDYTGNTASYVIVRGCRAWENSDDGFDTNYDGYVEFDSCWAFNNGNLLSYSEGQGFKIGLKENDAAFLTRKVSNCIMAYNANTGLTTNEDGTNPQFVSQSMHIYNNTSYHNGYHSNHTTWGWGYSIVESSSSDEIELSRIFRNNISYGNAQSAILLWPGALYTHDHNTWDTGVTVTNADFLSVDSTGITGVRQSNGSLPILNFLKLASGSDLINAGTDVGMGNDIGAYQYEAQDPPIVPSVVFVTNVYPSTNYATVNANLTDDGGGTVTERGVCWSTAAYPTTSDDTLQYGTGEGVFTATLTGLTSGTLYHVRAYGINEAGVAYSTDVQFTTLSLGERRFVGLGGYRIYTNNKNVAINTGTETPADTLVTSINVAGSGGATTISTDDGTLQMYADVSPDNAADTTITWSRINRTGTGSISSSGLLTALTDGIVTAKALANDASGIYDTVQITISNQSATSQIIADHTIVDRYDDIPAAWIDSVKKMWLSFPGESHSYAIRTGLAALEAAYPAYAVSVKESGVPEAYTTSNLRASAATWGDYSNATGWIYWYGEEDWFTNTTAIARTKASIKYAYDNSLTVAAMGFGWCSDDLIGSYPTTGTDPVYGVHWYGNSINGPEGNLKVGLDAEDYAITGNTVSVDTYLSVTQEYIDYCLANGYPTKVFFTTGPVDSLMAYVTEKGYQTYLKHERIRDYVDADATRILFDYADILCYDDDGTPYTMTWNGHTYPAATYDNQFPITAGHISDVGALRLAKAMWWMLARIAGWDGS